jgi:CheY-like chemotaxis protein
LPLLDNATLTARLDGELARTRRLGGFVSIVLFGKGAGLPGIDLAGLLDRGGSMLAANIRGYDFVGAWDPRGLVVVMPGSAASEAVAGGRRLLGALRADAVFGPAVAAGIASAYGDIEGGAPALLEAAEEALGRAGRGQVVVSEAQRGRPHVLVVDDDAAFAQALAETITADDWEADPCTDPTDALERVRGTTYHGLFVDLVLPRLTGVDILRESLAHFPRRPAILMSGHDANHEAILDALALGPVMFVRKPISAADLDAALRMFRVLLPGAGPR